MNVDLNAARAARAEAEREPKTFTIGDEEFTLPHEFPLAYVSRIPSDLAGVMLDLLGKEQYVRLDALPDLTLEDLKALVEGWDDTSGHHAGVLEMYGLTLGESAASPPRSTNTSRRSRRTSPVSTRA